MDPLSLTGSIIAVLQLTSKLTGYLNNVRNASAEQKNVAIEASNLYALLTGLRFRVEAAGVADDLWFQQVKMLGCKKGPLDQLSKTLAAMIEKIPSSSRKRDQIHLMLKWQWT